MALTKHGHICEKNSVVIFGVFRKTGMLHLSPKHFQGEQAGFTMKSFKGLSNKLGPLCFISQSM
jgi:hypothetical protein